MRFAVLSLGFLLMSAPLAAQDDDAALNPHRMAKADGEPDTEKCLNCHNDDMSLARSKLETCTMCHSATTHAGTAQHLGAEAAAVKRLLEGKTSPLPLDDDGKIYCGTCHVFHDPAISAEEVLPNVWLPARSGLPEAIRQSLSERWQKAASARGETAPAAAFSTRGTTRLRLPIDDGTLCRNCHGNEK